MKAKKEDIAKARATIAGKTLGSAALGSAVVAPLAAYATHHVGTYSNYDRLKRIVKSLKYGAIAGAPAGAIAYQLKRQNEKKHR